MRRYLTKEGKNYLQEKNFLIYNWQKRLKSQIAWQNQNLFYILWLSPKKGPWKVNFILFSTQFATGTHCSSCLDIRFPFSSNCSTRCACSASFCRCLPVLFLTWFSTSTFAWRSSICSSMKWCTVFIFWISSAWLKLVLYWTVHISYIWFPVLWLLWINTGSLIYLTNDVCHFLLC